jgi:predicted ATP-grasp superfamily ATP-dependent carboligase
VTDGEQRAALAVVRSLGNAGYTVHVCSSQPKSMAGGSKFATSERLVANALTAPKQFLEDVRAYARDVGATIIIPITEPSLLAILPHRETFDGVCIPFTDAESFRKVSDKAAVLEAAQRVGIAIPSQQVVHTPSDATALAIETLSFPLVIKPARSVAGEGSEQAKFSVRHAATPEELRDILREIDPRAYPLLLQQRIVGPGIGIFVLVWDGELIAAFSHRRIREHPPSGGVSVYRESYPLDTSLLDRSRSLLATFGWQGVAMIEYKVDQSTNTPYLMEINGRFWGSLQLAIDAGVDFPTLLLRVAGGEKPTPVTTYTTNVRSRWEWGEVNHLIVRLKYSDQKLALPPGFPSRIETIRQMLNFSRQNKCEIFRLNDWRPFWRETVQWFRDVRGA